MMALLRDPALQAVLQLAFAALLLQAAFHKTRDPRGFASALRGYRALPERLVRPATAGLIGLELSSGGALLWPGAGPLPALAASGLLLLYAAAIGFAWQRGLRDIDCGCGGFGVRRRIGPELVLRNLLLAGALAVAALPASGRSLHALDAITVPAALAAAVLLFAAAERALAAAETQRAWRMPA